MCVQCNIHDYDSLSHSLSLSLSLSLSFSGADLAALVREASIDALKEHMSLNPLHLTGAVSASTTAPAIDSPQPPQLAREEECVVCMRHFTNALKKIHPSVSVKVCVCVHLCKSI